MSGVDLDMTPQQHVRAAAKLVARTSDQEGDRGGALTASLLALIAQDMDDAAYSTFATVLVVVDGGNVFRPVWSCAARLALHHLETYGVAS